MNLAFDAIRKMVEPVAPARPTRFKTFPLFLDHAPLEQLRATRDAMLAAWDAVQEAQPLMRASDDVVAESYYWANAAARMRIEEIDRAIARRSPANVRALSAEEQAALIARCNPSTFGRFPGRNGAE